MKSIACSFLNTAVFLIKPVSVTGELGKSVALLTTKLVSQLFASLLTDQIRYQHLCEANDESTHKPAVKARLIWCILQINLDPSTLSHLTALAVWY